MEMARESFAPIFAFRREEKRDFLQLQRSIEEMELNWLGIRGGIFLLLRNWLMSWSNSKYGQAQDLARQAVVSKTHCRFLEFEDALGRRSPDQHPGSEWQGQGVPVQAGVAGNRQVGGPAQ